MSPSGLRFANSATSVERARCVRIIERHIAFWQRPNVPNQAMIDELKNILLEIQPFRSE